MNCYFRHFVPLIWYSSAPSTQRMSSKVWRVLNFGVSSSVVISVIAAALTFGLKQYIPQMFTPDKWVIVCLDNDAVAWKLFPNYWSIVRRVHRGPLFPFQNGQQCGGALIVYLFTAWLTHWGRDKMTTISQTTYSNAFSWKKMYEFRLKF